jgi:hypothetical protein
MKKLFFLAAISSVATFNNVKAQTEMNTYAVNTSKTGSNTTGVASNGTAKTINAKAIKNFSKDYHEATTAEWSQLKDKGFMCRFSYKGVLNRAFYSSNGSWLGTISSYQEAQLPKDIRAIVKRTYYDYAITFVNEINLSENRTTYLVYVEDEKSIKILRIADDEMEVFKEIEK